MQILDEFIFKILVSDFLPTIITLFIVFLILKGLYSKNGKKCLSIMFTKNGCNKEKNKKNKGTIFVYPPMETSKSTKSSRYQRMIIIFIPITTALICTLLYRHFSSCTFKNYILFAIVSVVINLIMISSITFFKKEYREKAIKTHGNYFVVTITLLTLAIPFCLYFIILSVLLSGFTFPFDYY